MQLLSGPLRQVLQMRIKYIKRVVLQYTVGQVENQQNFRLPVVDQRLAGLIKGNLTRDFQLQVFFINHFPFTSHLWIDYLLFFFFNQQCKVQSTNLVTKNEKLYVSTFFSSIAGVVDTGDKHSFTNISANVHKNSNFFNGILTGMGTLIHERTRR